MNRKQKAFCELYVQLGSPEQAAELAGYTVRKHTTETLLNDMKVLSYIHMLQREKAANEQRELALKEAQRRKHNPNAKRRVVETCAYCHASTINTKVCGACRLSLYRLGSN